MVFCYRDGFLLLLDPTASRKEHSITIYFCQYSWEVWLQKWMQTFWPKSLSMHCLEAESRRQKVYMLQMRNTETSKLLLIFIEGLEAPSSPCHGLCGWTSGHLGPLLSWSIHYNWCSCTLPSIHRESGNHSPIQLCPSLQNCSSNYLWLMPFRFKI